MIRWYLAGMPSRGRLGRGRLQPLYGIGRPTVDADFEIERRCAGRRHPDRPDLVPGLDGRALGHVDRSQMPVERVEAPAVIDDDDPPEAGERVGVGDSAGLHDLD